VQLVRHVLNNAHDQHLSWPLMESCTRHKMDLSVMLCL